MTKTGSMSLGLLKAVQNATLHPNFHDIAFHDFMIFRPKRYATPVSYVAQAQISEAPPKTPRLGLHFPWQLVKNSLPQKISTTPGRKNCFKKKLPSRWGPQTTNLHWGVLPRSLKINTNVSKTCHPRCFLTWRPGALGKLLLGWLNVSTHLKNIRQNGSNFPILRDENKKSLKIIT